MTYSKPFDHADQPSDSAAPLTSQTLLATQRLAHEAIDTAARTVAEAGQQADDLTRRGSEAFQRTTQHLRDSARQVGDSTLGYIRQEPLKAVLFAAAGGAALALLLRLLVGSRA